MSGIWVPKQEGTGQAYSPSCRVVGNVSYRLEERESVGEATSMFCDSTKNVRTEMF